MTLLQDTQALLAQARQTMSLREIAAASGGSIQLEWLRKFSTEKIPDPSVNLVQSLHDRLTSILAAKAA